MSDEGNITDDGVFTGAQLKVIDVVALTSSALGLCGALFVVITFLLFKEIRTIFATRLLFFLSVSNCLVSVSWFPFGKMSFFLCHLQAMGQHFFLSSSLLWTMCISLSLYFIFYPSNFEYFELSRNMKYYHILCWGLPLVLVIVCFASNAYGDVGAWCFIDPSSLFPLFYYIPLLAVFLVNFLVFISIRAKIAEHRYSMEARMNLIVSFYLVAFMVAQVPAVINGIQNVYSPKSPLFLLTVLHAFFQPLQGFLNSIVYGFNEGFISQYILFFERYFCKCRKGVDYEQDGIDTHSLEVEYDYHSDDEVEIIK